MMTSLDCRDTRIVAPSVCQRPSKDEGPNPRTVQGNTFGGKVAVFLPCVLALVPVRVVIGVRFFSVGAVPKTDHDLTGIPGRRRCLRYLSRLWFSQST